MPTFTFFDVEASSLAPDSFPIEVGWAVVGADLTITSDAILIVPQADWTDWHPGTPMDNVLVALAQTIRHFFDEVERFDLVTLRCDSGDAEWRTFESALRALRKSVAFQVFKMAEAYEMPLSGEFAEQVPRAI